jgi:glutamate carboxypeptidase
MQKYFSTLCLTAPESAMLKDRIESIFSPLQQQSLDDLNRLVNINSFTGNVEGLDSAGKEIVDIALRNGLELERIPAGGEVKGASHLFMDSAFTPDFFGVLGHFDTVHPPGGSFNVLVDRGDVLTGPGVQDMKSGVIAAIYAIRVTREALGLKTLPVKILFNCDEETGSIDSRPLIEKVMNGAQSAFIFEGRRASDNALVTSRKGIMMGHMTVRGKAAHAGEAPQEGANAIVEAAYKIAALDVLTDFEKGMVVTTGKINGGATANQIPEYCHSSIDVRFRTRQEVEDIESAVRKIMESRYVPGCSTNYFLTVARPPFERNTETEKLRQGFNSAAAEFGIQVAETEAGGGSDGNLTAALGVPTLDGLGPSGDHAHTHQEYIYKASFFDTVKIFALFLANLIKLLTKEESL